MVRVNDTHERISVLAGMGRERATVESLEMTFTSVNKVDCGITVEHYCH